MDAKVILPLDGSKLSEQSLAFLHFLTRMAKVRVDLVMVKEGWDDRASAEEMQIYLDERAADLRARQGFEVQPKVREGIPYLAILEEAEPENVSMIVTATHGRGSREHFRVGSVADKVIRGAPCPTLVIGPSCLPADAIDLVIVPLDGSRLAETALTAAGMLAQNMGTPVMLVRVVESKAQTESLGEPEDEVALKQREADAAAYLADISSRLPAEVRVDCVVKRGPLTETLINELESHPTGLVVMSSHGGQGFRSYALGSVTDQLLLGPLPVLVVGPGQAQRMERLFAS